MSDPTATIAVAPAREADALCLAGDGASTPAPISTSALVCRPDDALTAAPTAAADALLDEYARIAAMSAGQKLYAAGGYAIDELAPQLAVQVRALLTPESLDTMAAFTTLYIASQWTPAGWATDVLVGGLVVAGLYMAGTEAVEITKHVFGYGLAITATSTKELQTAGHHLAVAVTKLGVDIVAGILLHKVTKSASPDGPVGKFLSGTLETELGVQMMTPEGVVVDVPPEVFQQRMGGRGRAAASPRSALFGEIVSETTLPDGATAIRSRVGKPPGRLGLEDTLPPGVEVGLEGWERAHSQGNITGAESARGIRYAPKEVNQVYQRLGIERFIRELFDVKPPDVDVILRTETRSHPGTLRLKEIVYRVDVERAGESRPVFEASIEVENTTTSPKVSVTADP